MYHQRVVLGIVAMNVARLVATGGTCIAPLYVESQFFSQRTGLRQGYFPDDRVGLVADDVVLIFGPSCLVGIYSSIRHVDLQSFVLLEVVSTIELGRSRAKHADDPQVLTVSKGTGIYLADGSGQFYLLQAGAGGEGILVDVFDGLGQHDVGHLAAATEPFLAHIVQTDALEMLEVCKRADVVPLLAELAVEP